MTKYEKEKESYMRRNGCDERAWLEYKKKSRKRYERKKIKELGGRKEYRKYRNEREVQSAISNPESILLKAALKRSKEKNLPCTITKEDIFIPKKCPILNIKLKRGKGIPSENSPSLDRIIPELGYVKGNVIVVSRRANRMKQDMTEDIMVTWLKFIKQAKRKLL